MSTRTFAQRWTAVLSTAVFAASVLPALPAYAAQSTDSLVSYWKFNESSGGAVDSSGDGYNGTYTGGAVTSTSDLPTLNYSNSRATLFFGDNDYVDLPDGYADFTSGLTISVWAKPTATKTWGRFIDFGNGDANDNIIFGRAGSTTDVFFEVYDGADTVKVIGTGAMTNNEWHHYLVTQTSTGFTVIYKDGVEVGSGSANVPNNVTRTNNYIARSNWAGDQYYQGYMDEIRIYNRVLSDTEIADLADGKHTSARWDGPNSTDWETAANWDIGVVPDPYTLLTIPNTTNDPVAAASTSGANLTILDNAIFDMNGQNFEFNDGGGVYGGGTWAFIGNERVDVMRGSSTGTVLYYGTGSYTGLPAENSYWNLIFNDGMTAYWPLNVGAIDVSGYEHDGSTSGASSTPDTAPTFFTNTGAFLFDGIDDYVEIPSNAFDHLYKGGNGSFAISLWQKSSTTSNGGSSDKMLLGIEGGYNNGWSLYYDATDNHPSFNVTSSYTNRLEGNITIYDGEWHHIVAMYDGSTAYLYIDGIAAGSSSQTLYDITSESTATRIGDSVDAGSHFSGAIDDVRIYNRILQEYEISALAAGHMPATASGSFTLDANLSIGNDFTLVSGLLDASASNYDLDIAGSWRNYGGQFWPRNSTVTFSTADGDNILSGGQAFANLTINTSDTVILHDMLDVDGSLSLSAGGLDASANNYNIHAWQFAQGGGTFTPRSGTLVLDSASDYTSTISSTLNTLHIEDPTENGLVGYWKLDDCQTNTAADVSGNGYDAALLGPPEWTGSALPSALQFTNSCALQFNGTADYFSIPGTPLNTSSSSGTVSLWVKPDATNVSQALFWTEENRDRGIAIDGTAQEFEASMFDGNLGDFRYLEGGSLTGNWQHVVFTWDIAAGSLALYVDGALVDSFSGSSWTNAGTSNPSYFGRYAGGADNTFDTYNEYFDGAMDDVRIYNKALTSNEVSTLYNGLYADGDNATATATLGGNLDASTLTLLSGKLAGNSRTVSISGDWNNYAGTGSYIAGTSTVDLDGASTQNVRGSTNFYTFEISTAAARTVKFGSGTTQSVGNLLTLTGVSSNILSLAPLVVSATWYLDVDAGATQSVSYVSPSYSVADAGAEIDADDGTNTDGGNNSNWRFISSSSSSSSSSSTSSNSSSVITTSGGGRGGGGAGSRSAYALAVREALFASYRDKINSGTTHAAADTAPEEPQRGIDFPEQRRLYRLQRERAVAKQEIQKNLNRIASQRGVLLAQVQEEEVLYRDVPTDAWFAPYVATLIEEGVATGYADSETGKPKGEFGVANPITLAEVLKMALESAERTDRNAGSPRNQSAHGTWAANYIATAEKLGMSLFTPDTDVHRTATRGEVIQTVLEAFGIPTDAVRSSGDFTDLPTNHPYAAAINVAYFYGVIDGDSDENGNPLGSVRPDDQINRAEVAKLIAILQKLQR